MNEKKFLSILLIDIQEFRNNEVNMGRLTRFQKDKLYDFIERIAVYIKEK